VVDGGLQMTLQLPPNPKDLFKIKYGPSFIQAQSDDSAAPEPSSGIKVDDLKQAAQDAVKNINFRSVTDNLRDALKTSARFVLSGGKEFFYNNPIFNNNGDLLVEAKYKS
jgi:hypothetical protein